MRVAGRLSVVCLCGLLSARAGAQTLFSPTIAPPTPQAAAPAPAGPLPTPDVPQPDDGQPYLGDPAPNQNDAVYDADTAVADADGQIRLLGHVTVKYRGYTLTSERADIDPDRRTVLFSGNFLVTTPQGQMVQGGQYGTLDLRQRGSIYRVTGARTTVPPRDLPLGIIEPLFIYGGTITGRPGFIDARGSQFTTCDFAAPHYSFGAKQIYLIPGRHLVAKYVTYFRDGHRLFTIPYLYIPLDGRLERQTLIPQVGYAPDTGYFAKVALGYALSSVLPGLLNLDAYQKKGLGTGFEQAYGDLNRLRRGAGTLSFYQLHDKSTGIQNISYSLNHQQQIGTVAATLATQSQENTYFIGRGHSKAQNTQLNLTRNVGAFNTSIQTNLNSSDYGSGVSRTLTSTLDNIFQATPHSRLETRLNYSGITAPSFGSGDSGSSQQRLDSNLDYTSQGRLFDLEVLGNKFSTLSGGTSVGYGGLERLPELRLATDGTRMPLLRDLLLPAATRLNLSVGDFNEPASMTHTQRAFFGLNLGNTTKTVGRSTFDYGGVFQQAFYGNDTAQYTLDGRAGYRLRIGSRSQFSADYTYLRPYGYTPFQFDFTGNTNNVALNFAYQETRQFRLTMATAFDFTQTRSLYPGGSPMPWQNLSAQVLFTPGSLFQMRTTVAYDINHGKLLDLTNFARLRVHGGQALDLATRYDPVAHRFSQTNYSLDVPFLRDHNPAEDSGYRLQAIGGYNAITSQFTYRGFAVTRSWHDFTATLSYQDDSTSSFQSGRTINFNFQLKAFPAFQPFMIGQSGQSLDPGLGTVY